MYQYDNYVYYNKIFSFIAYTVYIALLYTASWLIGQVYLASVDIKAIHIFEIKTCDSPCH